MRSRDGNQKLADLWHKSAQITRSDIFGVEDALRPQYQSSGPKISQIDVAALGYVGPRLRDPPVSFVSVNPAGAKGDPSSTEVDDRLYSSFEKVREACSNGSRVEAFDRMNERFSASIPTWTIWRQYIEPILHALRLDFEETCYLYLVPFRTEGDAGSRLKDSYTRAAYERSLKPQLDALQPGLIIAVDRPSERYCREWSEGGTGKCDVFYYTRKRDAHSERRRLLAELARRNDE